MRFFRRGIVGALMVVVSMSSTARSQSPPPSSPPQALRTAYDIRGLPAGWTLARLNEEYVNWDDFGDRHRWVSGSSSLVLIRGIQAASSCPELVDASARARAKQQVRSVAKSSRVTLRGKRGSTASVETVKYLEPVRKSLAAAFFDTLYPVRTIRCRLSNVSQRSLIARKQYCLREPVLSRPLTS